jgi:hypothetical protein
MNARTLLCLSYILLFKLECIPAQTESQLNYVAVRNTQEHAHGTLIIVSATASSIVIAADGGLTQGGRVISTKEHKILRVNNDVACFLAGSVRFDSTNAKDRADLPDIARKWITEHRQGEVLDAYTGLTALIAKAMSGFRSKHPEPHFTVSVGCVGFNMGAPTIVASDFYLQSDTAPQIKKTDHILALGVVIPLGRANVATEILRGNSDALLSFKKVGVISKYREASKKGTLALLSERELIAVSAECLNATETRVAQKFDPKAAEVAAPNHFAIIDQKHGFRWATP